MISMKTGRAFPVKRFITTVTDASAWTSTSAAEPAALKTLDSVSIPDQATDIAKDTSYVHQLYKFDREQFQIQRELVSHVFKAREGVDPRDSQLSQESTPNEKLLKIEEHLRAGQVQLLLEAVDEMLFESPELLKSIRDIDAVFIRCYHSIVLSKSPTFNKLEEKKRLVNQIQKLLKFYDFLKDENMVNVLRTEYLVKTLMRNNRVIQAYNVLQSDSNARKVLNLINLEIKISGDGVPETWIFPTGKTLNKDRNASIPRGRIISAQQCIKLLRDSQLSPDATTINNLILTIGKSKNIEFLEAFIESIWGTESGKTVTSDSLLYPNNTTLTNIVYSYAYNGQFLKALKIVNDFVKIYKFKFDDDFWFNLFKVHSVALPKDSQKLEMFHKLWDLMKAHNKTPSLRIYSLRASALSDFFQLRALIDTLPEIYHIYYAHDPIFSKVVMKQYLQIILRLQAQRYLYNQSLKLIETWSLDHEFKTMLTAIMKKNYMYYNTKMLKRMEKEGLNDLAYIDDDDDFSLY